MIDSLQLRSCTAHFLAAAHFLCGGVVALLLLLTDYPVSFGCSFVRLFGCSVAFVVVVVVSEWQWSTEDWEMADARWQTAADEL